MTDQNGSRTASSRRRAPCSRQSQPEADSRHRKQARTGDPRRGAASLIHQGCRLMQVIHGIWAYGALQLWAEDSVLPAQAPPRLGRPSRAPRPHPFAAPPGELADSLADAGAGDLARKAGDDELTLRLPARVFPAIGLGEAGWCGG